MKKTLTVITKAVCTFITAVLLLAPSAGLAESKKLTVGSKEFTEQRILGQLMIQMLEHNGFEVVDKTGLGGTLVVRSALMNDQIDVAMEYTGTGLLTILKHKEAITNPEKCYETVKTEDLEKNGIVWLEYAPYDST